MGHRFIPKLNPVVKMLVATAQARDLDGILIEVVVRYRLKVNLIAEILLFFFNRLSLERLAEHLLAGLLLLEVVRLFALG